MVGSLCPDPLLELIKEPPLQDKVKNPLSYEVEAPFCMFHLVSIRMPRMNFKLTGVTDAEETHTTRDQSSW